NLKSEISFESNLTKTMKSVFYFLIFVVVISACGPDEVSPVTYDPTPYQLNFGRFPDPHLPDDNLPTIAGVQLGRMLFYEKALSKDGSIACADCHQQKDMFSDIRQFSIGVDDLPGKRQAMPLFNLAWHKHGMFWDGRAPLVRDQALKPIQDPLEMNETLENVVTKLEAQQKYRDQFIRAFGDDVITSERVGLAIEQFEFTMISNNSKFDQFERGEISLTESEERGRVLFFREVDPFLNQKGGECFHCHGGFNFTNDQFMNNGLDSETDFEDLGRFMVTNDPADMARFKVPSLRNVALTSPYMHDGRFSTLEEVINHYNIGVKSSSTVDEVLFHSLEPGGLQLNTEDINDLVSFLKTLTDESFRLDPRFSSDF
ncbi:MAG TPA: cytochrome c peroxidase, partial [Saprospiraceae bacterium]|nr:cytochrome c peroxidase [Saprospiraceae bacterium]